MNVSSTRVVVKNMPYELKWQDIKDMFRKEGNRLFAKVVFAASFFFFSFFFFNPLSIFFHSFVKVM